MYKQKSDSVAVSVRANNIKCIFEINTFKDGGSTRLNVISGGTLNSVIPSNLYDNQMNLFTSNVPPSSPWFLVLEGETFINGQVRSCKLTVKNSPPSPVPVTPNRPPEAFEVLLYAGNGQNFTRMCSCSPYLRSVILFKEYLASEDFLMSNYTDYYTLVFA